MTPRRSAARAQFTRTWLVPALVFAGIVLLVYWRAWTPIPGARRAFSYDSQWQYWGELQFQVDAWRHGEWPWWNPYDRLGNPFHADPQPGTWYPVQWLLIAAGCVMKTAPWWLISVKNLLHMWLLPTGMYALCRHKKYPGLACYLAGVVVLMSQPVMWLAPSALNWSFAWAPWWLLATLRWIERPDFGRSMWVGVTLALAGLAGAWASVWYAVLAVVPIASVELWRVLAPLPAPARRQHLRRIGGSLVVAIGMLTLLLGPQMLDTLLLLPHTVRADRDLAFFGTSVIDGVDVIGLFLPRGTGQITYLGWIPIVLTGLWVMRSPRLENLTLVAIMAVAMLLAFGDKAPMLPAAASLIAPFDLFRRAHRYAYVWVLPFGLLVGGGCSAALAASLPDAPERAWWLHWIKRCTFAAVVIGALGYALKASDGWQPNAVRDGFGYLAAAALVGGAALYLLIRDRGARLASAALLALVVCELWFSSAESVEAAFAGIPRTPLDAIAKFDGLPTPHRIYDGGLLGYHPGIRLRLRDLGGYEDHPLALQRYARVMAAVHRSARLAAHTGVTYMFATPKMLQVSPEDLPLAQPIGAGQWFWRDVAPMVVWHDVAKVADDATVAWQQTSTAAPGQTVSVERTQWSALELQRLQVADSPNLPRLAGVMMDFQLNALRAAVFAPSAGLVTINEMYFPSGWRAWDNGIAVPIRAVNGYARGIFVEAGPHNIVMTYQPPRWWWTVTGAALAWMWVLVVVLRRTWQRIGRVGKTS